MRTTVTLPEDLHRIASSIARDSNRNVSQVVEELMRRGLELRHGIAETAPPPFVIDQATGLPMVRSPRPITSDDMNVLEDEA